MYFLECDYTEWYYSDCYKTTGWFDFQSEQEMNKFIEEESNNGCNEDFKVLRIIKVKDYEEVKCEK